MNFDQVSKIHGKKTHEFGMSVWNGLCLQATM